MSTVATTDRTGSPRIVSKILQVIVATVLLIFCGELLGSVMVEIVLGIESQRHFHKEVERNEDLNQPDPDRVPAVQALTPAPQIKSLTVIIHAQPSSVSAEYDLQLSSRDPLVRAINAPSTWEIRDLANAYLGSLKVNESQMAFERQQTEYSSLSGEAHIRLEATPVSFERLALLTLHPANAKPERIGNFTITLKLDHTSVGFEGTMPDALDTHTASFQLNSLEKGWLEIPAKSDASMKLPWDTLFLQITPESKPVPTAQPNTTQRNGQPHVNWNFSPLWQPLPFFIPYGAVLVVAFWTRSQCAPVMERYFRFLWPLVCAQVIYAVANVLENVPLTGWIAPLLKARGILERFSDLSSLDYAAQRGTTTIVVALLGMLFPLLLTRQYDASNPHGSADKWRWRTVNLLGSALVVGGLLTGCTFLSSGDIGASPQKQVLLQELAYTAVLLTFTLCLWILNVCGVRRGRLFGSASFTAVFVVFSGIAAFGSTWSGGLGDRPWASIWIPAIVFAAVCFVLTFLTSRSWSAILRPYESNSSAILLGLAFFVAIVCFFSFRDNDGFSSFWSIWPLISIYFHAALLFFVLVVLLSLRRISISSELPLCDGFAIACGIILVVGFCYLQERSYTPLITAGLSYLMLRHFLLRPIDVDLAKAVYARTAELLPSLVNLDEAERLYRQLRKGLSEKLSKGETTYFSYEEKLEPLGQRVADARRLLQIHGRDFRAVAFAFGPANSCWTNGLWMAVCSIVISAAWIGLNIQSLLKDPTASQNLLSLAANTLSTILPWALYGFFFGYFFGYLRGRSGIWKSLAFFLVLAIPQTISTLLGNGADRTIWRQVMFWLVEVFITCGVLGIVADMRLIYSVGRRWTDLFEVYNITALSAWSSAFLLAVGAAVTSAVTGQIPNLLNLVVKLASAPPPIAQPVKPPSEKSEKGKEQSSLVVAPIHRNSRTLVAFVRTANPEQKSAPIPQTQASWERKFRV